jgi:hypothetical protein
MARSLIIAVLAFACRTLSVNLSVTLSTGDLALSPIAEAHAGGGLWVFAFNAEFIGSAHAMLSAALVGCGSVHSFLPPASFLVHADSSACWSRAASIQGAMHAAPLPTDMRLSPQSTKTAPRLLHIALAEGGAQALPSVLAALPPGSCDTCELLLIERGFAHVSAAGSRCAARCSIDAPNECGCIITPAALSAIASAEHVVYVDARSEPARPSNAYQRQLTQTTDVINSGSIAREFGVCSGAGPGGCALADWLPISGPDASAIAALFSVGSQRGSDGGQSLLNRSLADEAIHGARSLQETCSLDCGQPSCGQGFGSCGGTIDPYIAAGLDGRGQLVHIMDSGLDYRHPLFVPSTSVAVTPHNNLPMRVSAGNAAVADYLSYADSIDSPFGHGTHVAGSVAGRAEDAILTAADKAILAPLHGSAPAARILFTDIGCDDSTAGFCSVPPAWPSEKGAICDYSKRSLCVPLSLD